MDQCSSFRALISMQQLKVLFYKIVNKLIVQTEVKTIISDKRVVYLTFDDGPEDGITEFVLKELAKYNFKATFFCRGDNAEKNPKLLASIRKAGHAVANHTYSHPHAYEVTAKDYLADVERANDVLQTKLLRPPHGSLTLKIWIKLQKKYKIVYWSLNSSDYELGNFHLQRAIETLKSKTKNGDIVLFHFCHRHEKETRQLLPEYLKWLNELGFVSLAISE